MSETRDIPFNYRGYKYIFRPPIYDHRHIREGGTLSPLVFRDYPIRYSGTNSYIQNAYCTEDEMPQVYQAIRIWLDNGWQESIAFQDLIDGLQ